jgi:hypothetical protein
MMTQLRRWCLNAKTHLIHPCSDYVIRHLSFETVEKAERRRLSPSIGSQVHRKD